MKTLIIHPKDQSPAFLKSIYGVSKRCAFGAMQTIMFGEMVTVGYSRECLYQRWMNQMKGLLLQWGRI